MDEKKIKPLLINTYPYGGAANACIRLHQGLLSQKVATKLLVKTNNGKTIPNLVSYTKPTNKNSFFSRLRRKILPKSNREKIVQNGNQDPFLMKRNSQLEYYSYPSSEYNIVKKRTFKKSNIINLHWVADFLDYTSFFKNCNKPVVWTQHDMNAFSGGEHYEEWYVGIDDLGVPIKRELTNEELDKFNEVINFKTEALKDVQNLHVVCPSRWLASAAKESRVFGKYNVHHIPYGLDTHIFTPHDKTASRIKLGLPTDKTIILFVADSLAKVRKGYSILLKVIDKIQDPKVALVAVGVKNPSNSTNSNVFELGFVKNDLEMSAIYSAADVFVIPSLMDNLPNTVLESLACGTPCIGFNIGGIPDMIIEGFNGYLAPEISGNSMYETIQKIISDPTVINRSEIRGDAVNRYALDVQAKAYIKLYKSLL